MMRELMLPALGAHDVNCLCPRNHFCRVERLYYIVIRTNPQAMSLLDVLVHGGQHDDRGITLSRTSDKTRQPSTYRASGHPVVRDPEVAGCKPGPSRPFFFGMQVRLLKSGWCACNFHFVFCDQN
jgi:hypothetical protein